MVSHGALRMSSVTHRDACMSVGACVLSLASSLFSLHAERTVVTQMCCTVVDVLYCGRCVSRYFTHLQTSRAKLSAFSSNNVHVVSF